MIEDLDYDLPAELIAQHPLPERDAARLLVVESTGALRDSLVRELPTLCAKSLFVFNNTRVFPARLTNARASGGAVEFLLVREIEAVGGESEWLALARPMSRLQPGEEFSWSSDLTLQVLGRASEEEFVRVRLTCAEGTTYETLDRLGHVPLPPYIQRDAQLDDRERYQTVYASERGAVAAPTAGLHFSHALLQQVREAGHETAELTLHVGPGTFRPIQEQAMSTHRIHREMYNIPETCVSAINRAQKEKRPVIAVGTTVVRALEASALATGEVSASSGETDIFIRSPFNFRIVDMLVTNFHLPRSTLLALVMAFAGTRNIQRAYLHAIEKRYRFYSYGDAMLLRGEVA